MSTDKSGAGYGNHGGDEGYETPQDNKSQIETERAMPDDSGKGDYDDDEDTDRAQALPEA